MIHTRPLILLAGTVLCCAVLAENPTDKPMTESDLLKQIEILDPNKNAATPSPATPSLLTPRAAVGPLLNPLSSLSDPSLRVDPSNTAPDKMDPPIAPGTHPPSISPGTPGTPDPADQKKAKGPTEITALEATFDQRGNVAVFIGSVVVKDPEFNVVCDKLTAYLKHDDKTAPATGAGKTTPKPVTPKPVTPAPGGAGPAATPAPRGGALDHAIAVTTSERRVIITQDKVEADGSITHGIGISDHAFYDAKSGDIILTGWPDVTQGVNRCIATDPKTWMRLNRDGKMDAHGPHKTIIQDDGSSKSDASKTDASSGPGAHPTGSRPPPQ